MNSPHWKQYQSKSAFFPSFHFTAFLLLVITFLAVAGGRVLTGSEVLEEEALDEAAFDDAAFQRLVPTMPVVAPVSIIAGAARGEASGAGIELSVGFPLTLCSDPLP